MIDLPDNSAAPTFESPLEMLRACHGRIMAQCSTLYKLLQHLPAHGCDAQARQAAQAILRYFDTAGQYHHQDEEMDLFPLLLATSSVEAHELVVRLIGEHHEMDAAWLRLRSRLQGIAEGQSATLEESVVATFSTAYERHIALENAQLLPLSARLLSPQQLQDLGAKMAVRRGVTTLIPA
jgi:hemerythrin-like domain-containing protein